MVIGHESVGITEKVSTEVKTLVLGDWVAIEPGIGCCRCNHCKQGRAGTRCSSCFYELFDAWKLLIKGLAQLLHVIPAAMNTDGKVSWEEIVDSRLEGKCDFQELNEVAALAYKCINHAPRKRPSMRDIMQVLMRIAKSRHHKKSLSAATADEVSIDVDNQETKVTAVSQHRREESIDSAADMSIDSQMILLSLTKEGNVDFCLRFYVLYDD
ncbi:hypothetical protein S83_062345 [Arachis hypogaea]